MQLVNLNDKEWLDRDEPLSVTYDDVTGLDFENYLEMIDSGQIQGIGRSDVERRFNFNRWSRVSIIFVLFWPVIRRLQASWLYQTLLSALYTCNSQRNATWGESYNCPDWPEAILIRFNSNSLMSNFEQLYFAGRPTNRGRCLTCLSTRKLKTTMWAMGDSKRKFGLTTT